MELQKHWGRVYRWTLGVRTESRKNILVDENTDGGIGSGWYQGRIT